MTTPTPPPVGTAPAFSPTGAPAISATPPPLVAARPSGALLFAVLLFLASCGAAVHLMTPVADTPDVEREVDYSSYGGDAYTGIQNAAADTEKSVRDTAAALLATQAEQDERVRFGLASLLVLGGGANLNRAARRRI